MNYLAHFLLADPDPDLMFGNFIGDGVRGNDLAKYKATVARGVRFHRFIDTYTDQHHEVHAAKQLFYPTQAKFSPVVVDVLFDHLLARDWVSYAEGSLSAFAQRCYQIVLAQRDQMPLRTERFFHYMFTNDLLTNYANREGMVNVLAGMDQRTRFSSNMLDAMNAPEATFEQLKTHFERFFPDLVEVCQQWRNDH